MVVQWKVCFDESYRADSGTWVVMVGVLGTLSQHRSLGAKWRKALHEEPRLEYFSRKEAGRAHRRGSPFYRWNQEAIRAKVARLESVVEASMHDRIACAFRHHDFVSASHRVPFDDKIKKWADWRILAFMGAVSATVQFMQSQEGRQKAPLVVFDRWSDSKIQRKVESLWLAISDAPSGHPLHEVGKWLEQLPTFADSKGEPALQAADAVAWNWRRDMDEATDRGNYLYGRSIYGRGHTHVWNRRQLIGLLQRLRHLKRIERGLIDRVFPDDS